MVHRRVPTLAGISSLLFCAVLLSCDRSVPFELMTVSLSNTDTFEHAMVGGDEEGAAIRTEPRHAEVSEIRRDAETNWVATYVYQPVAAYVGSDHVQIEIYTGSDGASPPDVSRLVIQFDIHE